MTDFELNVTRELATLSSEIKSLRENLPCTLMQQRVRQLELNGARNKGILAGLVIAGGAVGGGVSQVIRALLGAW